MIGLYKVEDCREEILTANWTNDQSLKQKITNITLHVVHLIEGGGVKSQSQCLPQEVKTNNTLLYRSCIEK